MNRFISITGTANYLMDSRGQGEKASSQRHPSESSASTSRAIKNSIDVCDSNSTDSVCNSTVSTILDGAVHKSRAHSNPNTSGTSADHSAHANRSIQETSIRRRGEPDQLFEVLTLNQDDKSNNEGRTENVIELPIAKNRFIQAVEAMTNNYRRTKSYYKFKVTPWTYFKVTLDRLKLLALLDRNLTMMETVLSIILGSLVSILGATLLYNQFYKDLMVFIFCFVISSCQYSLLKSVQPDAASPTHGFNRVIAYSRPIYFCIFSILILLLDSQLETNSNIISYSLNNFNFNRECIILYCRDFLINFIVVFPILFSLGLFPQINTFTMYLLEQIDMHIFGGNAMSSLLASMYCVFRSILVVIILNGLAYGGLSESKGSQHMLFSIFCACLVASSYHLSRSASDPMHIWNIFKKHLWLPDIYRENESGYNDEYHGSSENPEKVREYIL